MITTVREYNKELQDISWDFIDKIQGRTIIRQPTHHCYQLDKPVHILVNNDSVYEVKLEDKGEYYQHLFPCFGYNPKTYTDDFAWVIDTDTVFYIERPFKNRVIKLLRKLLPDKQIRTIKNDIIIDGIKIGPTQAAGPILDWEGENNPDNSSLICCLRWSNPEGLDDYFAGDPNHEKRKASSVPLGSLDMFLGISQEEFIEQLEKME